MIFHKIEKEFDFGHITIHKGVKTIGILQR